MFPHLLLRQLKLCGGLLSLGLGFVYLQSQQDKQTDSRFESILKHAYERKPLRVAIIGSGIGGTSAAHFTRELLGSSVRIDVFEKNNVTGGRAAVVEVDGKEFEAGGAVIHESNRYMDNFAKLGELTKIRGEDLGNTILGLYDGDEIFFTDSKWKFVSLFKLFWRYGFSLITMNRFLEGFLKDFVNIYKLQEKGESFETVQDMLKSLGNEEIAKSTNMTARTLLQNHGVSERIINELATAVTLCNYGQGMDVNAFVGMVSLAGAQDLKLWIVKGGNYQICHHILQLAKANVFLNRRVGKIKKVSDEDGNPLYEIYMADGELFGSYHSVIVASPLEVPDTNLSCEGCRQWLKADSRQRYQSTVATFVHGNVNPKKFGYDRVEDVPENIFATTESGLFFRTIGMVMSTQGEKYDKKKLKRPAYYKVFSEERLTDRQLSELFSDIHAVKVVPWLAYPRYSPPEQFLPFVLDEGVFYTNAIERAASAMEMSAISGRNAALLCKKFLDGCHASKSPGTFYSTVSPGKGEL